jgi:hypothetical protein
LAGYELACVFFFTDTDTTTDAAAHITAYIPTNVTCACTSASATHPRIPNACPSMQEYLL